MSPDVREMTATEERGFLRRQGMVGYITFHTDVEWDGRLHQRLARAEKALRGMPAGSEVVLVRTSGVLYYQVGGRVIGQLLTVGGRGRQIQLSQAARRLRIQASKAPARRSATQQPTRWRGHAHRAYLD
jgi:hypothetical protein